MKKLFKFLLVIIMGVLFIVCGGGGGGGGIFNGFLVILRVYFFVDIISLFVGVSGFMGIEVCGGKVFYGVISFDVFVSVFLFVDGILFIFGNSEGILILMVYDESLFV